VSLAYDAGALIAADRNDRRIMALHHRLLQRKQVPTVLAAVLAQAWRGGPQPDLSRSLPAVGSIRAGPRPMRAQSGSCARPPRPRMLSTAWSSLPPGADRTLWLALLPKACASLRPLRDADWTSFPSDSTG